MSGPAVLTVGDRVRADAAVRTVVGFSGVLVRLVDACGGMTEMPLTSLQSRPDFAVLDRPAPRALPATGLLEGLPDEVVARALWWGPHILEVLHGVRPDAAPGTLPQSLYDPSLHSLTSRERAKAAEFSGDGQAVTARTVQYLRQRYEARGVVGLVDHRADPPRARCLHQTQGGTHTPDCTAWAAATNCGSNILHHTGLQPGPSPTERSLLLGRPVSTEIAVVEG
ncbi:hypothetical protein GCM10009827_118750 [Dactylosporangium maewongense]|uniref:Uncharacterized protein n=1 Tax=Dactylosporangium maewongense TaxID=634393 RepID=A0ABN2DHR9_9ACTN